MSWVKFIWFLIQYGPDIAKAFKALFDLLETLPKNTKWLAKRDLKNSLRDSKAMQDFKPVSDFTDRVHHARKPTR